MLAGDPDRIQLEDDAATGRSLRMPVVDTVDGANEEPPEPAALPARR